MNEQTETSLPIVSLDAKPIEPENIQTIQCLDEELVKALNTIFDAVLANQPIGIKLSKDLFISMRHFGVLRIDSIPSFMTILEEIRAKPAFVPIIQVLMNDQNLSDKLHLIMIRYRKYLADTFEIVYWDRVDGSVLFDILNRILQGHHIAVSRMKNSQNYGSCILLKNFDRVLQLMYACDFNDYAEMNKHHSIRMKLHEVGTYFKERPMLVELRLRSMIHIMPDRNSSRTPVEPPKPEYQSIWLPKPITATPT